VDYIIRKATLDDRGRIKDLIDESARGLSREYYSQEQIEAAIRTVFGVDTDLIRDGTYFIAESGAQIVGCGGWSKRKTLFGGDQFSSRDDAMLDPLTEPAKIRAFFVHPDFARRGIARQILTVCETEAAGGGFRSIELMATLPGVPFYKSCGYSAMDAIDLDLGQTVRLGLIRMSKELSKPSST
jgi:N-acetylglutamate synthase-like GNAT family acetyltransferase